MLSKRYTGPYHFSLEDYNLILNALNTGIKSKYVISEDDNKLRFRNQKEYTLFFLVNETDKAVLKGLDGYGMRDKSFNKSLIELIQKIKNDQ